MTNAFAGEKVGGLKRRFCLEERLAALRVASIHYHTRHIGPKTTHAPNNRRLADDTCTTNVSAALLCPCFSRGLLLSRAAQETLPEQIEVSSPITITR
jgi:hypothetical protein